MILNKKKKVFSIEACSKIWLGLEKVFSDGQLDISDVNEDNDESSWIIWALSNKDEWDGELKKS